MYRLYRLFLTGEEWDTTPRERDPKAITASLSTEGLAEFWLYDAKMVVVLAHWRRPQ